MGNIQGGLSPEELEELKSSTQFSEEDMKKLHRRFKKIDNDGNGTLSSEEFHDIPGLVGNPLLDRVLAVFDTDGDGEIQFSEFISALSIFCRKDNPEQKLKFAFQVYDINKDGFISNGELYMVLKKMVGNNLDPIQLQQIVDKTIREADKDGDGKVSYEEFRQMIGNAEAIEEKLTVSLS
eukprot:TRINITY_DN25977_c0_g1_i1.p1 TRINITY_DN25977_c0_g1~~TRINITY_DN25977_c0_g1_i1.p1  ORF type:complete len:190 (+),score=90.04 TRINITY_DN25977_c0_g1_i1:33-572(+)